MPRSDWKHLSENARDDLLEWFNIAEPDVKDKARLAALYFAGRFHAWNCPDCEERVYWGDPDDWGHFQGVRQADYTSYPGVPERHSLRHIAQQCNSCRMNLPPSYDLDLVGIGEPSCWPDERVPA